MATLATRTCVACQRRPSRRGTNLCWECTKDTKENAPVATPSAWSNAKYVLWWNEHVLILRPDQDHRDPYGQPMLKPTYLGRMKRIPKLPKTIEVINLDLRLPHTAKQVRGMKARFYEVIPKHKHFAIDGSWRMESEL